MKRRTRILLVVIPTLMLVYLVWTLLQWPPPGLILTYGLPPAGGPTGNELTIEGITFVELSPGYFRMGSHELCEEGDLLGFVGSVFDTDWGVPPKHDGTECPTRWVEIEEPFWIATTEVTNEVMESFVYDRGDERCEFSSEDRQPAVRVSWHTAQRFCREMRDQFPLEGGFQFPKPKDDDAPEGASFRLPTEAEWEYACRAGTTAAYSFGEDVEKLRVFGHVSGAIWGSDAKPEEVGGRQPNSWGLFDMHGNVWEWCRDEGPTSSVRVFRGGGCRSTGEDARSAARRWTVPGRRIAFLGFRPVMVVEEVP